MNGTPELNETSTLKEVLDSEKFAQLMRNRLADYRTKRNNTHLEAGSRLKRAAWDTLSELGMLHPKPLADQFLLIAAKKCVLSTRERDWIQTVVTSVVYETVDYFTKLREAEAKKVSGNPMQVKSPRKPRAKKAAIIGGIQPDVV